MKIKIQTLDGFIELGYHIPRIPIVGEQVRIRVNKTPYKFDVTNVIWDFIEGEVVIEVN